MPDKFISAFLLKILLWIKVVLQAVVLPNTQKLSHSTTTHNTTIPYNCSILDVEAFYFIDYVGGFHAVQEVGQMGEVELSF